MADQNVSNYFNNLPIETLIAAPLRAAADSNLLLAKATYDFIDNVWFDSKKATRVLAFNLTRPIQGGGKEDFQVNAPAAALAQLPNLMIRTVDVEFTMEVKDTQKQENKVETQTSLDLSASYLWFSAKLSGKVTTSSTNTRQTDQSAKYDVRVHAEQAPATEGMNKLAQIFASVIEPISTAPGK